MNSVTCPNPNGLTSDHNAGIAFDATAIDKLY